MRAFREMRHYIKQNQQFVTQSEMHLVSTRVSEISVQMSNMADRQKKTEQDIQIIQKNIDTLNENFVSDKDFKNFVIYKGQLAHGGYARKNPYEDCAQTVTEKPFSLLFEEFTQKDLGLINTIIQADPKRRTPPATRGKIYCHFGCGKGESLYSRRWNGK